MSSFSRLADAQALQLCTYYIRTVLTGSGAEDILQILIHFSRPTPKGTVYFYSPAPHAQSISTTAYHVFGGPPLLVTNFLPAILPSLVKNFHCPPYIPSASTPVANWVATIYKQALYIVKYICLFIVVNNKNNKSGSSTPEAGSIPPMNEIN
jgi:hypothetical protein